MQKFLSKYALAVHLALLLVAPLFMFPFFSVEQTATVVLWGSLFSFCWLLLEPSRRVHEYLFNARKRVFGAILSDPLFWVVCFVLLLAFIAWLNAGVELVYGFVDNDWRWTVKTPRLSWLPGSDSVSGYAMFSQYAALVVVLQACRHALGKSARTMFVFSAALFAGVAALAAVFSVVSGNAVASGMAFAHGPESSFAGSSFGLFFLAAVTSFSGLFERGWNRAMLLFSFAAGATFTGLWCFAPPMVTFFYAAIGLLLLLVCAVYVAVCHGSLPFFKFLVALIFAAAIPVLVVNLAVPAELAEAKSALLKMELIPEGYAGSRSLYSAIASDIWQRGNVWLGAGAGSFPLCIRLELPESGWVNWIPNGWWQLLAERGIVGLTMLVLPFCFLGFTFLSRLCNAEFRRSTWAFALFGVLAFAAVVAEGFFNASLLRPEVLVSAGAFLAIGAASFPPRQRAAATDK